MIPTAMIFFIVTPIYILIEVGDNLSDYGFSCGANGEVVPLEAMCNGSVECANGNDETHAFCPKRLRRPRGVPCEPSCARGTCVAGTCDCPDSYFGETCQLSELSIQLYYRRYSPV